MKAILFHSRVFLFSCLLLAGLKSVNAQTQLYGLTSYGGNGNFGTLFHFSPSTGIQVTDHYLSKGKFHGYNPVYSALIEGGNGKFYGMTKLGGYSSSGVIFEWDPVTKFIITKYHFDGINGGRYPCGSLTYSDGKLYGMTSADSDNGFGDIFEFDPVTEVMNKVYLFDGITGGEPKGSLALYNGKFYGMTSLNGGTIFEWNPVTNVYIKKIDLTNSTGNMPTGSLTLYGNKFYGMTANGGNSNSGVIFEWDPVTSLYTKKIDFIGSNGSYPAGSLTYYNGKLYGMTSQGGANGYGVIFEWNPLSNGYIKKVDFNGTDGRNPYGDLCLDLGKFHGMTQNGGNSNYGVIFEWDPSTNSYSIKVDFNGTNGGNPDGSLTLSGGKFYGMTSSGGTNNGGVIFEWDPALNTYDLKFDFRADEGFRPLGSLSVYNGKLYGMNSQMTFGITGNIFEWDPATTTYTKKIDFVGSNGYEPSGALTLFDGKFYGMTPGGGQYGGGVLFEWDPETNIYSKRFDFGINGTGSGPYGSLTLLNGKFYGMTVGGGFYNNGVIFEWDPVNNIYAQKIDFNSAVNGAYPYGSLTEKDGKFYGMTSSGGIQGGGVIFEWDPVTNICIKKYEFDQLGCIGGVTPIGSLALYNGKLYGMTNSCGQYLQGVIFEFDPVTNVYTKKYDFNDTNGGLPNGSLLLISGKFYGLTRSGGAGGFGVLFEWDPLTNIYAKKIDFIGTNGSTPKYTTLVEYPQNVAANKTVSLASIFPEGLYTGFGTLRKAQNETGDQFPGTTADQFTVELHNAANYNTIAYTASNVNLSTSGTLTFILPSTFNGSYYITLRHRNSIATVSASPISFSGASISYTFNAPAQVYGNNLHLMNGGDYAIYSGDVNQDGVIDTGDMLMIDNDGSNYLTGYLASDTNGDGIIDTGDMLILDNNSSNYISSITP